MSVVIKATRALKVMELKVAINTPVSLSTNYFNEFNGELIRKYGDNYLSSCCEKGTDPCERGNGPLASIKGFKFLD